MTLNLNENNAEDMANKWLMLQQRASEGTTAIQLYDSEELTQSFDCNEDLIKKIASFPDYDISNQSYLSFLRDYYQFQTARLKLMLQES